MKKILFYSLIAFALFAVYSCKDDEETIAVSGLTIDKGSITLVEGETITLTATVTPDNATDKTVSWTTSDASVATVCEGKVSAVKEGEATITAKSGFITVVIWVTVRSHNLYTSKAFSVSATKKVYFSSGNLQYHCKNKEWRFAPFQYYRIGYDNENISDDYDGYIDLFGWGTGNNPTLASANNEDYTTFADWGSKIDGGDVWQTPTSDEWAYLITGRENASEKYGVAEVDGVHGLILLPDDWMLPADLSFCSGVTSEFGEKYYKTKNNYSSGDWHKMESAGAVFLPTTGLRHGTDVGLGVGECGYYWSSSANNDGNAWDLEFFSDSVGLGYPGDGSFAHSVRLVRPL